MSEAFKYQPTSRSPATSCTCESRRCLLPDRSRAIAGLCTELTATETLYPGIKLCLVLSVKGC